MLQYSKSPLHTIPFPVAERCGQDLSPPSPRVRTNPVEAETLNTSIAEHSGSQQESMLMKCQAGEEGPAYQTGAASLDEVQSGKRQRDSAHACIKVARISPTTCASGNRSDQAALPHADEANTTTLNSNPLEEGKQADGRGGGGGEGGRQHVRVPQALRKEEKDAPLPCSAACLPPGAQAQLASLHTRLRGLRAHATELDVPPGLASVLEMKVCVCVCARARASVCE